MIIHIFLFSLIRYFLLAQVFMKVFEFLRNAQIWIKFDSSNFNLWIFYRTWANKKYLTKLNKKLWIIIFLMHFYHRFSWPKNSRNFEFYLFLKFYNSNSFMSIVAHLAKIDSLSFDLPPKKISWFLDNINYAFFII